MNIKTFNTVVLLLLLTFGSLTVEAGNDDGLPVDIKASLIYVSPGYTAYTAYGHCAIRMQCPSQRLDYCFTYGLDDSSQSYVSFFSGKGKGRFSTFYTHDYLREYKDNNRQVSEYELNLSLDEKRNLWALLDSGISGESIPYDYLKTNCSSMCVRAVESVLDKETIEYKDLPVALLGTYRDFVRHISVHKPWCGFFWNTILGSEGESKGSLEDKLSPASLVDAWEDALIVDSIGAIRPVFTGGGTVIVSGDDGTHDTPFTPALMFGVLLVAVIVFTLAERKCKLGRAACVVDVTLLSSHTIIGLFICYMSFISDLPGTSGSWYAAAFNPMPLFLCLTYKNKTFFRYILAGFALVLLLLIILTPFIPQLDADHALLEGIFAVRCAARGTNCRNNYINAKKRQ